MQELRKSQNQDLRDDLVWSMNSGNLESNPGDFPGFRRLRVAASSSGLKGSEILWPPGVGIFHRSGSSLLTSLVDLRSTVLCARSSHVERRWSLPQQVRIPFSTQNLQTNLLTDVLGSDYVTWVNDSTSPRFCNEPHLLHVLFVKVVPGTTFTSWSKHHLVVIGKADQQVRKASHCRTKQQ